MSQRQSHLLPAAVVTVTSIVTLLISTRAVSQPAAGAAAASQPAAAVAVGPIAYYVAKCARCHGDISAAYVGLQHPQTGKQLEQTIDDMAYGPAQAPLDPKGLKDQTDLHEAMYRKQAYVWLDASRKDVTAGELLPGTTLTFEPAANIKVSGTTFELPKQKGTLVAKRDAHIVRIPIER